MAEPLAPDVWTDGIHHTHDLVSWNDATGDAHGQFTLGDVQVGPTKRAGTDTNAQLP